MLTGEELYFPSSLVNRNSSMKEYNNRSSAASPITFASSTSSPSCHLAELDNNTLSLYGPRSLDALDKTWGDKGGTNCTVECISFKFINFQEIVQRLKTLNERFTAVQVRPSKPIKSGLFTIKKEKILVFPQFLRI